MSIDMDKQLLMGGAKILLPPFLAMLFGFCTNITRTVQGTIIFLAMGWSMFMLSLYYLYTSLVNGVHHEQPKDTIDAMEIHYETIIKKRRLTFLLFYLLPTFPIVYLLAATGVITADQTQVGFRVCSMSTKVFYVIVMMNAHTYIIKLLHDARVNESRRAFLRYVMHEVRVPLNSVTAGIGILRNYVSNDDGSDTLDMMDAASVYMAETLNNILSMQKIEEGKLELVMNPFMIEEVMVRVKKLLTGLLIEKNLNLVINVSPKVPRCLVGDCYRLEHVIANLISNAVKCSPDMGNIEVTVACVGPISGPSCQVKFSVTDEGPGLTEYQISRLFQPFSQLNAHELQQGGGTGVGLSICKKIVEQHGGNINVVSTVGKGSTFYFTLPLAKPVDNVSTTLNFYSISSRKDRGRQTESFLSDEDYSVMSYRRPEHTNVTTHREIHDDEESGAAYNNTGKALIVDGMLSVSIAYLHIILLRFQTCNLTESCCVAFFNWKVTRQIKRKMELKPLVPLVPLHKLMILYSWTTRCLSWYI